MSEEPPVIGFNLGAELASLGLADGVSFWPDGRVEFADTVDLATRKKVQAIVKAHDPTEAYPEQPSLPG